MWQDAGRRNMLGWHWSTEYMLCSSIVLCRLFQAWLNKQILKHFKHGNQHCQNRTQTEQLRPIKLTVYLRHDAMPCDAMRYDSSDCKWPKLYKMSMFDAELTDRQADKGTERQRQSRHKRDETASWIVELLCRPQASWKSTSKRLFFRCSAVFPHRIR